MIAKFTKEYNENQELKRIIFTQEAKYLNNFIVAFRKVYQNIYTEHNITLNNETLPLLPIMTINSIAKEFSTLVDKKVTIRLVSDNPRNPNNLANNKELEIINKFKLSKSKEPYIELKDSTLYAVSPLYIDKGCIKCHGEKSQTLLPIQEKYNTAFGYKLGELRGIIVTEINEFDIVKKIDSNLYRGIAVATVVYLFFIASVVLLIKVIRDNELKYSKTLEEKVAIQLNDLQIKEQMLFHQSKMASMGEMIGNIAHQWRQPLSSISTVASGMKIEKEYGLLTDQSFDDSCNTIVKYTQYLSKTIDDFRDFLKLNKTKTIFTLDNTITNVISILGSSMKHNYIEVIYENNFNNIKIDGYENELSQALLNIINNAKDALIENQPIERRYILINVSKNDTEINISIKDNACGINPDIIDKIFEPYFTTKHKSQGTGLGLYMTYRIISESFNGKVIARNIEFDYLNTKLFGAEFIIQLHVDDSIQNLTL